MRIRKNDIHQSTTDPDARLFRKSLGTGAKFCFMGHVLMESRNGLIVGGTLTTAGTCKEWDAGLELSEKQSIRPDRTLADDEGYDTKRFLKGCVHAKFATIFQRPAS